MVHKISEMTVTKFFEKAKDDTILVYSKEGSFEYRISIEQLYQKFIERMLYQGWINDGDDI